MTASPLSVKALKYCTARSLPSSEVCDKGKPGESRRRKATRLRRNSTRHASRAAESHYAGGSVSKRSLILAVTGLAVGVTACGSYGTSVDVEPTHNAAPVASISIGLPLASLLPGQTEQGTAIPRDATGAPLSGRVITWQSSNPTSASVNGSGMIAAVAPGAATITASSEGITGQESLTVMPPPPVPVANVGVSLGASSLVIGQTTAATATLRDAQGNVLTGRSVTWQSTNPNVASVSGTGSVSALAAGTATISASSEGQVGSAGLTVTAPAPIPVATVTVSPSAPSIQVGSSVQLSAVTRDANGNTLTGRSVTWQSSNQSVATVSANGNVSGVGAGSATITASSEGQSGSSSVTVTAPIPVATVTVSPSAPSIQTGASVQLSAVTRDANGNTLTGRVVTWSSSSNGVATVSSSGNVTGVAAGSATITATSETQTGTATVTVTLIPIASISVSPSAPSVNVGATVQLSATARDAGGNVLTGRTFTWASGNGSIAQVSPPAVRVSQPRMERSRERRT
jgi:uncharacterized protein YjdB